MLWFVCLAVWCLVSSPVAPYPKKEELFVNEATGTSDAGGNSVANHPKGLGKERVREEVEVEEAQAKSEKLQWGEVEALSKQMSRKRLAKQPRSPGRWLDGRRGFLTVRSQRTGTAMAKTSAVDNAQRAIALRSALLHR